MKNEMVCFPERLNNTPHRLYLSLALSVKFRPCLHKLSIIMNLKKILEQKISLTLAQVSGESDPQALINHSKSPQFGDYQANGVMALAKRLKRNPRELGEEVIKNLELDEFASKIELAGPGFINIFIAPGYLVSQLNLLKENRLVQQSPSPQTVVIDYSSPNLAKEMHVGHSRGTILGDAIARIFEYMGHKLIRQNHFGDWGTQFGMLIAYMQELEQSEGNIANELSDLETFYRASKQRFDADPEFAQRARENVVKLQSGDEQCLKMWKSFIDISVQHCQALYKKLGITLNENDVVPESFYNDRLQDVITSLDDKKILSESDGAKCVFLEQFKNKDGDPLPTIVQKSDGGYLYATTDLAAIRYRNDELKAARVLYVVDARQSLHFQQVFAVSKLAGFADKGCSLEHLSYGTIMGTDGKPFKTRSGDTIKLINLIDEAIERALQIVTEKNPELADEERQNIAEVVGISAIKYADLSKNRNSDYIFDWNSMLSFEGNTAPYMLYAYARIRSIFRRQSIDPEASVFEVKIKEKEEKDLALKILQFTEVVEGVTEDCYPNHLCLYLYELAGTFMKFYEACPVLKAEPEVRDSRLGLCQLSSRTLKQGLELLGIHTLEKM
jgi:arginyl-tRNA synthetase